MAPPANKCSGKFSKNWIRVFWELAFGDSLLNQSWVSSTLGVFCVHTTWNLWLLLACSTLTTGSRSGTGTANAIWFLSLWCDGRWEYWKEVGHAPWYASTSTLLRFSHWPLCYTPPRFAESAHRSAPQLACIVILNIDTALTAAPTVMINNALLYTRRHSVFCMLYSRRHSVFCKL